jgi:hypothetical protein
VESAPGVTEWQLKEAIKQVLFRRGIDENKIVVLIIDEGQKLPGFCIEILREFLNFETNHFKLLQIVIFAQPEFNATLERRENFADRMNVCLRLKPLDFSQMRQMIEHRIEMASQIGREPVQFTLPALAAIYLATGGVPRKVVMLCHQVILAMIIQNRSRAGWILVQSCLRNRAANHRRRRNIRWGMVAVLGAILLAVLTGVSGKRDVAGEPIDGLAAYQARISDKTVRPLEPWRTGAWQTAEASTRPPASAKHSTLPSAFRKSIPKEQPGGETKFLPGRE